MYLLIAAQKFSMLAYLAVWVGMVLAIASAAAGVFASRACIGGGACGAGGALGIAVCQGLLDAYMRVYDGPHYFNATWIAYAVFAWMACDWAMEVFSRTGDLRWTPAMVFAVSLVTVTTFTAGFISRDSGSRDLVYGSSLSQQMAAVGRLEQFSADSPRTILLEQWEKYPGVLTLFPELNPAKAAADLPKRKLIVKFRNAFRGDAAIVVEDRPL